MTYGFVAHVTLTENITSITLNGMDDGGTYRVIFEQAAGLYTVTGWPAAVKWVAGSAPVISAVSGEYDVITLESVDAVHLGSFTQGHG